MTAAFEWNPRDYLPDEGECFEQLSRARASVVATKMSKLLCEVVRATPPSAWRAVGTVMALRITHPDVPGTVHVYWLAENPGAVRVARAAGPGFEQTMRDAMLAGQLAPRAMVRGGGLTPSAGIVPPPHEPCFELVALRDDAHSPPPSLLTAVPEAVAAWVARWHFTATEIVHPKPAVPRRAASVAISVTWDDSDMRLALVTSDLDVERLGASVPRNARGVLDRKVTMLLAPLGDGVDSRRASWIVARCDGPTTLVITVDDVIAANHRHRLDLAPWLWRREEAVPLEWTKGTDPTRDEQIRLVEQGAIPAALELAGVELDSGTQRLLSGHRLSWWSDPVADSWPVAAVDTFARSAPWLIAGPAHKYVVEQCRSGSDGARLVLLPHQSQQSKVGISLVPGRKPRLEVRTTASNRVLPLALWQRPPET